MRESWTVSGELEHASLSMPSAVRWTLRYSAQSTYTNSFRHSSTWQKSASAVSSACGALPSLVRLRVDERRHALAFGVASGGRPRAMR